MFKFKIFLEGAHQFNLVVARSQMASYKKRVSVELVLANHNSPQKRTPWAERVHNHQKHRRCAKVQNHGTFYLVQYKKYASNS